MGRIGLPELVVILFIVLLIFAANRLPDIFNGIGKGVRNFKNEAKDPGKKKD